jgi:hypothetical protein
MISPTRVISASVIAAFVALGRWPAEHPVGAR